MDINYPMVEWKDVILDLNVLLRTQNVIETSKDSEKSVSLQLIKIHL